MGGTDRRVRGVQYDYSRGVDGFRLVGFRYRDEDSIFEDFSTQDQ